MAFKKKKPLPKIEEPKAEIVEKAEITEKEEPKEEVKSGEKILKTDLSKVFRKGMVLPEEKYNEMKSRGIDVDSLIE